METLINSSTIRHKEHTLLLKYRLDATKILAQASLRKNGNELLATYLKLFLGTTNDFWSWESIYPTINSLHYGFGEKLRFNFPSLTDQHFRLCCLLRAEFRSEEISALLNYENPNTIFVLKNRIYKKMGFSCYNDFKSFLMNL